MTRIMDLVILLGLFFVIFIILLFNIKLIGIQLHDLFLYTLY